MDGGIDLHPVCWKPPGLQRPRIAHMRAEYYTSTWSYTWRSDIHAAGMLIVFMMTRAHAHPFIGVCRPPVMATSLMCEPSVHYVKL
jgi:hypothetical protein